MLNNVYNVKYFYRNQYPQCLMDPYNKQHVIQKQNILQVDFFECFVDRK